MTRVSRGLLNLVPRGRPFGHSGLHPRSSMVPRRLLTLDSNESLFNYTSGHWICNESQRLTERRLVFDIPQLIKITAEAANQHPDDLKDFCKIAEGGSYRVFEAVFQDKRSVIVRLPYPCSIPHYYGLSSEVATMDFLRNCGLPIPRVHKWDATALNPAGSAYMIMEKVEGREIYETWYTMSAKERQVFVERIVKLEKRMFDIKFPASGSLYYKHSLGPEVQSIPISPTPGIPEADNFCIGPSSKFLWWYHGRGELPVPKGPWSKMETILRAPAERERAWLTKHGTPRFPREAFNREVYGNEKVDPNFQIEALSDYIEMVPKLVPGDDALHRPILRHPDLSPSNIFVSNEGNISGLLDWQHCAIMPLYLHTRVPEHFQYWGDEGSERFQPPSLPTNYNSLEQSERDSEDEKYRRRQLHYFYVGFTGLHNAQHSKALWNSFVTEANKLFELAGHPWEGDNASLKAGIIRFSRSLSLPTKYTEIEEETTLDQDAQQKENAKLMRTFRDHIGCNIENWVPAEDIVIAIERAKDLKTQGLANAETDVDKNDIDRHWPFQDHEEID